jgi:hypothetical protein
MNYHEYVREGHFRYEAFAGTVAAILRAAIGDSEQDFHVQQISSRAKSSTSLYRKLTERDLLDSSAIETELKDLAGCRIVFYTNTDIDRFLEARLIFENLKVDFDDSKTHHVTGLPKTCILLSITLSHSPTSDWYCRSIANSATCAAKFNSRPSSTMPGRRRRTTSCTIVRTSRASDRSSSPPSKTG